MNYNDYETTFSVARLTKYRTVCNGDNSRALILYRHNIKLWLTYSQSFRIILFIEGLSNFRLSGFDISSLPAMCRG